MKWLGLLLLIVLLCSCSTFEDRRSLYRPDPLGGYGGSQYVETTSTGFHSMPPSNVPPLPQQSPATPRPEFRY
jgi:hypothetical protein